MTRRILANCSVCLLLLLLPSVVAAQSFNATLSGTVQDPSGLPVPDAELSLISIGTSNSVKLTTSSDGSFSFPNLQSGEYELKASAKGFKDFLQKGIQVLSNQTARIQVKLELGAESQTIEVLLSNLG